MPDDLRRRAARLAARAGAAAAGALAGLVLLVAGPALIPVAAPSLAARPAPAATPAAAAALVAAFDAGEEGIRPECRSRVLRPPAGAARSGRAVVLMHGLTSCPRQMLELGREMAAAGDVVVMPRMPGHGIAEGGGANLDGFRAEHLRDHADRAVDAAAGLGETVVLVGFSAGGVAAGWAAQERGDADRAVVVSPALALAGYPAVATRAFTNVFARLRNLQLPRPGTPIDHTYWRSTPSRPVAETFRLGRALRDAAGARRPAGGSVAVVVNEGDRTIDPGPARELAAAWERAGARTDLAVIPASAGVGHDLMDVEQPDARPEAVYPVIIAAARTPPPPGRS